VKVLAIILLCAGFAVTELAFSLDLSHSNAATAHLTAVAIFVCAWLAWRQGKRGPST
jgi:hypothetical protein